MNLMFGGPDWRGGLGQLETFWGSGDSDSEKFGAESDHPQVELLGLQFWACFSSNINFPLGITTKVPKNKSDYVAENCIEKELRV